MIHHNQDDKPEALTPAEYKLMTEEVLKNTERVGFSKGVAWLLHHLRCSLAMTVDQIDAGFKSVKDKEMRYGERSLGSLETGRVEEFPPDPEV